MTQISLSMLKASILNKRLDGADRNKLISLIERELPFTAEFDRVRIENPSDYAEMLFNQWTRPTAKSSKKALTSAANGRKGGRPKTVIVLKMNRQEAIAVAGLCEGLNSFDPIRKVLLNELYGRFGESDE